LTKLMPSYSLWSYISSKSPAEDLRLFRELARGAYVQTFNPEAVGGAKHLELTLKQTWMLMKSGQLLAKKPEVDFLQRVAGTTQIGRAVKVAGARPEEVSLLVLFGDPSTIGRAGRTLAKRVKLVKATPSVGKQAASRLEDKRRAAVVGVNEPDAYLLAEDAALLRR